MNNRVPLPAFFMTGYVGAVEHDSDYLQTGFVIIDTNKCLTEMTSTRANHHYTGHHRQSDCISALIDPFSL